MTFRLFLDTDGNWLPICELDFGRDYSLGRSRKNDIVVHDEHCSRVHLRFFSRQTTWYVEQADAKNSTFVDHEKLAAERPLKVGETIVLGSKTLLRFSDAKTTGPGDVSSLLHHVKNDSGELRGQAQHDLVEHYFQRLCQLAKYKSNGLDGRAEDPEDAVVSAWASFFRAVENGGLNKLDNRTDLWRVLATFTARKVIRQRERQCAKKRDSKRIVRGSSLVDSGNSDPPENPGIDGIADAALNHEIMIAFQESVDTFLAQLDQDHRNIAEWKLLEGLSDGEIGHRLNCSERTIKRRVAEMREAWQRYDTNQNG